MKVENFFLVPKRFWAVLPRRSAAAAYQRSIEKRGLQGDLRLYLRLFLRLFGRQFGLK